MRTPECNSCARVAQDAVHSAVERAQQEEGEEPAQAPADEPPAEEESPEDAPTAEVDLAPAADVPLPMVMASGENGPVPTPDDEGESTDLGCSTDTRGIRLQDVRAQIRLTGIQEETPFGCETVWRIAPRAMVMPWPSLVPKLSLPGSLLDKILICLPLIFSLLQLACSGVASGGCTAPARGGRATPAPATSTTATTAASRHDRPSSGDKRPGARVCGACSAASGAAR